MLVYIGTSKANSSEATWWKKLSRKAQQEYKSKHKLSRKKNLNILDRGSKNGSLLPKTLSSEEQLKQAGFSDDSGLSLHSLHPSTYTEKGRMTNRTDEDNNNYLPTVHPEHPHWQGFRKEAIKHAHIEHLVDRMPAVSVHRAYSGITELMGGNTPNHIKRSSAEEFMLDSVHHLHDKTKHLALSEVLHTPKELVSAYFGSIQKRYKNKPIPFPTSTQDKLRKYVFNSKSKIGEKTPHDHFHHVGKFMTVDFIEWLSSQDKDKLVDKLKQRKNNKSFNG